MATVNSDLSPLTLETLASRYQQSTAVMGNIGLYFMIKM
jgi:hypothetical protein